MRSLAWRTGREYIHCPLQQPRSSIWKIQDQRWVGSMSRLCILMYHMISEPASPLEQRFACPPERFATHLRALRRHGYSPVSLSQVRDYISGSSTLPEKAVAVTLDDGYADNHSEAWPILVEHGFPATVFVTVGTVSDQNSWMLPDGYPARQMLNWSQIQEMHMAGIQIGSHTMTHPRLSTLGRDATRIELIEAKKTLEDRLGAQVDTFAYPYGDWSEQTLEIVREAGHSLACSIRPGFNRPGVDPLLLRRIEVYGTDPAWKVLQKMHYGSNRAGMLEPLKYYWRRAAGRLGVN